METEEEERLFKAGLRARLRRAAQPLYLAFFVLGVFLASIQCVLLYGGRPAIFWVPVTLYALAAAALLRRRRWFLALYCVAGAAMLASVFSKAAALKARRSVFTRAG